MPSRVDIDAAKTLGDEPLSESPSSFVPPPAAPASPSQTLEILPPAPPLPPEEEAQPGRVLAERYRLLERLGHGAHGEVWAVLDFVIDAPAALKWMHFAGGTSLSRIQREITALRMLRVPGVVRLLDDGFEDGRPFLVMERVHGLPFPGSADPRPGAPRRFPWAALADPTFALLEILSRVHAAGVVHRDLKPENILVSPEGLPTVLDFGVSLWSAPGSERLTAAGQILGTPVYLAPEQILGRAVDARADLYAVGVMLYEALTGQLPHEALEVSAILRARLASPPLPARDLAPDLPAAVATVIDRLLATRVEDRFRSASEVLSALRGEAPKARVGPVIPRLGGRRAIEEVQRAVAEGRSIDVVGPTGSGRSRCLAEVAEALEKQGRRTAFARPARSPLASLEPVVGERDEHATMRLAEITAWVEERLRETLANGVVVFADDAEQLDPWSHAALERGRGGPGVIVRALLAPPPGAQPQETTALEPLEEEALRALFAGPDRLFHLREDAARLLWERSLGLPARIEAEVTLWARLGLCRWDGAALVVDRDALGVLRAGLPGAALARSPSGGREDEPHLAELLRWLALGGHHLELPQLAQVMGQPVWKLEAACEALVDRGAARWLSGLRVAPRGQVDVTWLPARRMEAHRAIASALRPGQEGRLFHLLAAESAREAAREAVEVAQQRASAGDLNAAAMALSEGLRAARQQGDEASAEEELEILAAWVKVAFAEATPHALDRVLYELTRARKRGASLAGLEALVRAGIAAPGAGGLRALEIVEGMPPFADAELERRRHRVRATAAAGRSSLDLLEEVLDEIATWSARGGEPLAALSLAEGQALLRYGEGRFEEAAALHAKAAELEPWLSGRIAATLNAASALLEAFQHREALARAEEGRALAARCRHPYWEGRAEWLLRAASYRMGEAGAPDLDLVNAVARLGVPDLLALVCLNEAAAALRSGERAAAAALAERSATVWKEMHRPSGVLLSRCLSISCGARFDAGEIDDLAARAVESRIPGIGVQALGLLGQAFPEVRARFQGAVTVLSTGIQRRHWDLRMDVLSAAEAVAPFTH